MFGKYGQQVRCRYFKGKFKFIYFKLNIKSDNMNGQVFQNVQSSNENIHPNIQYENLQQMNL